MANVDNPNGFSPSRHIKGGVIRADEYPIASGYAADIFTGDWVIQTTNGVINVATAGATNLIGVFAGCEWTAVDGKQNFSRYWPSGTVTKGAANAKCYVYDDPDIAFAGQTGGTTAFAQTMVGANCDIIATHAGNAATGQSGQEVDITSPASTTAQLRVLGLIPRADNALGANADIEVMPVEHLKRPAGTVGI